LWNLENGADMFAVAILSEAIKLRHVIKDKDILILGYSSEEFFDDAINNNITLTIYDYNHAVKLKDNTYKQYCSLNCLAFDYNNNKK